MKKNNYLIFLFLGILLWTIGFVTTQIFHFFFDVNYVESLQRPLFEQLAVFPPIIIVVFIVVVAPIVEEFSFRYWTKLSMLSMATSFIGIMYPPEQPHLRSKGFYPYIGAGGSLIAKVWYLLYDG